MNDCYHRQERQRAAVISKGRRNKSERGNVSVSNTSRITEVGYRNASAPDQHHHA